MANERLEAAAQREARQIDETLFFEICAATRVALPELDIQVVTAPNLRLAPRASMLTARVSTRPSAGSSHGCWSSIPWSGGIASTGMSVAMSSHCSPFPREMQRCHAVAHHARKGAGAIRAGQACAGRPNSTPGAIPASTAAATVTTASS